MDMTIYTIYTKPIDFPGHDYVVRRWQINSKRKTCDFEPVYVGNDLDAARRSIPGSNFINIGKNPTDARVIKENWIRRESAPPLDRMDHMNYRGMLLAKAN